MESLPARVRRALGDADVTGWAFGVIAPGDGDDVGHVVRGRIGDTGNIRLLFDVTLEHLDPIQDADAYRLLASAQPGSRLAFDVACQLREHPFGSGWGY